MFIFLFDVWLKIKIIDRQVCVSFQCPCSGLLPSIGYQPAHAKQSEKPLRLEFKKRISNKRTKSDCGKFQQRQNKRQAKNKSSTKKILE